MEDLKDIIYTFMMEEGSSLLLIIDNEGVIKQANKSAEKLVGRSLSGTSFSSMLIDFQGNLQFSDITQIVDTPLLLNVINTEGLPLTYYFHFSRFKEQILAIGQQNAAETDQMRRDLLSLNNDLNNLTRELHKKNARLEQLDKKKNQFFGMASHDLRHPLGVINMYSGFLEIKDGEKCTAEHAEFLGYIRQSGLLMEDILNDFLDFAIFESGKLELNYTQLDLVDFLRKIIGYSQPLARRSGIELQFKTEISRQTIYLDRAKMEQVMNNLISNGIKFSPENSIITVELNECEKEVHIRVVDEGPGIEEKDLITIFSPFERTDRKIDGGEKSSGLGLAIVKKIIDTHGGRVWARNRKHKGAAFTISLPLR